MTSAPKPTAVLDWSRLAASRSPTEKEGIDEAFEVIRGAGQIAYVLRQVEAGSPVADVCRQVRAQKRALLGQWKHRERAARERRSSEASPSASVGSRSVSGRTHRRPRLLGLQRGTAPFHDFVKLDACNLGETAAGRNG